MDEYTTHRGAIWDLDGVLVDTAPFHCRAWQAVAAERGYPFTQADFQRTFGQRNQEIIATLFEQDLSSQQVQALAERKEQLFRQFARGHIRPLPGALALLRGVGQHGFRQALATSTPRANAELILGELGVSDCFQVLVCAEDVRVGKPDPEVFLLAARRLGLPPPRCVVLEDAVPGAQAAVAAGTHCLAVAGERPLEAFASSLPPPCRVVRTLEELTAEDLAAWLDAEVEP
ncbi:MAG: HAD family phosphatase [Chloroflexi bacterium]|nr:HAD family phosphatase [Chloroflexota bacterium]